MHFERHSSHLYFRIIVRNLWNARAEIFFDALNNELPYFLHRYAPQYMAPHTSGDLNPFYDRVITPYEYRNPQVFESHRNRILKIYSTNHSIYDQFDVLSMYNRIGMTVADYYLEDRINRFYRILFFFQELRSRGISCENDDIYPGALPFDVVPEDIQAIIYDDNV